jgi:hypothetical protein
MKPKRYYIVVKVYANLLTDTDNGTNTNHLTDIDDEAKLTTLDGVCLSMVDLFSYWTNKQPHQNHFQATLTQEATP